MFRMATFGRHVHENKYMVIIGAFYIFSYLKQVTCDRLVEK